MVAMRGLRALDPIFRRTVPFGIARGVSTDVELAANDALLPKAYALLREPDAFKVKDLVSISEMMENRMHLGHKKTLLNPFMKPFIYGSRFDQLIIDLEQSREHMVKALNFVAHIAYNDGIILLISRHNETAHEVEKCAMECKEFAHVRPWYQGMLTNCGTSFGTEIRLPDLGLFITTRGSQTAANEFAKLMIPSVGVVDTDTDPRLITYPVPGNDDSTETIRYYIRLFKEAILRGKERRKRDLEDSGSKSREVLS
ncbi:28S ribosomal protein S2, mitochondrial [Galendromus occidentalis]|uniref:28S ribosomal protein S2, mitochondrial n=1 Tax=Galendromus occidentalis TaxID=34638 RepID=A0AAJ6QY69_9ACAR|nr:28S ribosomal protein S2, mitochondrial [Galendromus occidentalis]